MTIINLFPLSIYKSKIDLTNDDKNLMIDEIRSMKKNSKNFSYKDQYFSWTGDTQGYEFLHESKNFKKLFEKIKIKITEYLNLLEVDSNFLNLFIQRSWATISEGKEIVSKHRHFQSHISFAYYLKKNAQDSNFIIFDEGYKNEIIPGIFRSTTAFKKGVIKKQNQLNTTNAIVKVEEDEIVIFPSKTLHSTQPTELNNERISISADIVCISKDSKFLEMTMPPINKWMKM